MAYCLCHMAAHGKTFSLCFDVLLNTLIGMGIEIIFRHHHLPIKNFVKYLEIKAKICFFAVLREPFQRDAVWKQHVKSSC